MDYYLIRRECLCLIFVYLGAELGGGWALGKEKASPNTTNTCVNRLNVHPDSGTRQNV